MEVEPLVNRVLDDEQITSGLDEEAATFLMQWLVRNVEEIAARNDSQSQAVEEVERLCRNARAAVRLAAPGQDQVGQLRKHLHTHE
jgi:hypothetical protein